MKNHQTEIITKDQLQSIVKEDFALPEGKDEYQAVQEVIRVLGSTDPVLRDELGMTILSNWLLNQTFLSGEQLEELLMQTLSEEKLFYKIGEVNSDSVFLRTFSSLVIALILVRDNSETFLSENTFRGVMVRLADYCRQERDLRGFVEGKGWAHGAAHISDAIDECVRSRYTGYEECKVLCDSLFQLLLNAPFVYDAEEDERIVIAVTAMVELNKIPLASLADWLMEVKWTEESEERQRFQRVNFKHFSRSLYMRLREKGLLEEGEQKMVEVEHQFNPNFYNI